MTATLDIDQAIRDLEAEALAKEGLAALALARGEYDLYRSANQCANDRRSAIAALRERRRLQREKAAMTTTRMPIVLAASDPDALRRALAGFTRTATVEAEYGSDVVEGTLATLAHHGPRADQPCPCLYDGPALDLEAIGISHLDLDALGGVLALTGRQPHHHRFWKTAALVDVRGAHRLDAAAHEVARGYLGGVIRPASDVTRRIRAFWAWSKTNRLPALPRGKTVNVTGDVLKGQAALRMIIDGNRDLLAAGDRLAEAEEALAVSSARAEMRQGDVVVLVRSKGDAGDFVNHLYVTPGGRVADAVVGHDPRQAPPGGALTLSFESAESARGVHAGDLLREVYGDLAGGHAQIGGSPRGVAMPEPEADRLASIVLARLVAAKAAGVPA